MPSVGLVTQPPFSSPPAKRLSSAMTLLHDPCETPPPPVHVSYDDPGKNRRQSDYRQYRNNTEMKMARNSSRNELIWDDERFNTLKTSKSAYISASGSTNTTTPASCHGMSSSPLPSSNQRQLVYAHYPSKQQHQAQHQAQHTTNGTCLPAPAAIYPGAPPAAASTSDIQAMLDNPIAADVIVLPSLSPGSSLSNDMTSPSPRHVAKPIIKPVISGRSIKPPHSLDIGRKHHNGYHPPLPNHQLHNYPNDHIHGLSTKLASQKLSHSYHSGYKDTRESPEKYSGTSLSHSYDSSLITRALDAQRSPESPTLSPVKSGKVVSSEPSFPKRTNGTVSNLRKLSSQELQVHHARQVYIRGRSLSMDPTYLNHPPLISPTSPPIEPDHSSPPSTPSTPSSSYSDPATTSINTSTLKKQGLRLNLRTISENINSFFRPLKSSGKTKSEGDLLKRSNSTPDCLDEEYFESDDGNQDDYGFLSYPSFRSLHNHVPHSPPSAMQKGSAASPSSTTTTSGSKLLPRRWRQKSKIPSGSPAINAKGISSALWKPEGCCSWSCVSGRKVSLTPVDLVTLTEAERLIFQKLALAKLQAMELGCNINIPKETTKQRSKSRGFTLKRRTVSGPVLDNLPERSRGKEPGGSGWVFGIPLAKCISNDNDLQRGGRSGSTLTSSTSQRRESNDVTRTIRKSSSSSGAISSDSLSENEVKGQRSSRHNLLDALSLSSSAKLETQRNAREYGVHTHTPHVPYIAKACFRHLETYGIQTLGIFRIGSSKKRIKQLREEFDSGKDVRLSEEHSPHDVGGLLKEYFRDLPDPLLTRDLYTAFVATRKVKDPLVRLRALHLLIALLPAPNRDTLGALLAFLNIVVAHSTDTIDANGETLCGNKMDAHNLATLFGPNILHKSKGGEFQVESLERAEERGDVINVVKEMIEHMHTVFQVSIEEHDEILRRLQDNNYEAVDILLKQKSATLRIDLDPETSSSFYEESDSSSIPHTPSSLPDVPGQPRTLAEALAHAQSTPKTTLRTLSEQGAEGGGAGGDGNDGGTLKATMQATYRLSAPDPSWYSSGRSLSPASPRVSPAPKALKSGMVADLHIRVTSESPERSGVTNSNSAITQAKLLLTPRTARSQRTANNTNSHSLTVPVISSHHRHKDNEHSKSNSSLSSGYYAGSSRSGTASPTTEALMNARTQWFLDTPPSTPTGVPLHTVFDFPRDASPAPPHGRPLSNIESSTSSCGEWQKGRWKHWERIAKEHSDDFHEQETLV